MSSHTFDGWATVNPDDSSGNLTTVWSASTHTGRTARSVSVLYTTKNTSPTITRGATITLTGAAELITIETAGGTSISSSTVTRANLSTNDTFAVTGKSNTSGLKFEIVSINSEDASWVTLPSSFTGDGLTINLTNGAADIPGDPGALLAYTYSINLTLASNPTISARSVTFRVSSKTTPSVYDQITITQSAGDPYLRINNTNIDPGELGQSQNVTVTIAASGGSANIYTFSNCSWQIVEPSL